MLSGPAGFEPDLPTRVPVGAAIDLGDRGTGFVRVRPGSGPPVVLLHGITASAGINWINTFEAIPGDRLVVAPDLRGHARGPRARPGMSVADHVADVVALLDRLEAPTATVVGFSMGGAVAQQLTLDHPDRVRALVLFATTSRFRMDRRRVWSYGIPALGARVASAMPGPAREQLIARFVPHPDPGVRRFVISESARHVPWEVSRAADALSRFRSTPRLAEIDTPTAVVVTTEDTTVHPNAQHRVAELISGAEVVECRSGHSGLLWQPEAAVPALLDALGLVDQG